MSRPSPQQHKPPPPAATAAGSLPTEVAVVVLVDELARASDRWNDVVREGGYLDRFVQRLGAQPGVAKQLRLSLLSFSPQSSRLQSPIVQTQYFVPPTEFWTSARQPPTPPSAPSPTSPGRLNQQGQTTHPGSSTGGEQGLLEALVGGIELFDLHTSHPFVLPTPSPSPPYLPAPSSGSSTTSNTSPQNASHLSPPNASSAVQRTSSQRPHVERYLFVFLGNDPAFASPPPLFTTKTSVSRWGKRPGSSVTGSGASKVRWNRTRKLDGVGWDQLPAELTKRTVRASLVGLGAGTTDSEMTRLKGVLKSTAYAGNDQAWFPTPRGDLFLLFGLDPTKNHLKRTHSQSQAASPAGSSSPNTAGGPKRQRVSPPNALTLPPNSLAGSSHPFPSVPNGSNASAMLQAAQGGQGQTSSQDQAARIQAMQRQLATNPAAMAQQVAASRAAGPGALHPSLQGLSVSPDLQAQYAALSNVALAQTQAATGAAPSTQLDLGAGNSAQANALAQQYHRQRLQAQFSSASTGVSSAVPSQASLPSVPSQQQQQQQNSNGGRPGQPPPPGRAVWKGELGWNVGGGKAGAVLGCRVLATLATPKVVAEDLQLPLWKERLQLTGVIALKIDELRAHASRGVACVRLMPMASADATPEQKSSGERSFSSLVGSLSSKNVAGIIRLGNPGCGMVVFPMSQQNKTTANPTGSAQLIAMIFLKTPIPFDLNARPSIPQPIKPQPNNPQQQQQQSYPQHQAAHLAQPPNLTVKTFPGGGNNNLNGMSAAQIQQRFLVQQRQQQQQQLAQQQQQQGTNNNFLGGGGGGGGAGLTDAQMAEFMKAYPTVGGAGVGGQRWP